MSSEIAQRQAPTISEALRKWLEAHGVNSRLAIQNQEVTEKKTAREIEALFETGDQTELAGRVIRGCALELMAHEYPDRYEAMLRERGVASSTANFWRDSFKIFNEVGDLTLIERAAELGMKRMQELRGLLKADGLRALIEDGLSEGITYDRACQMTAAQLREWKKTQLQHRRRIQLAQDRAAGLAAQHALVLPGAPEPREVTVAREEALAIGWRMRADLGVLAHAFAELQPEPGTERGAAMFGAAALTARALREILHDAEQLLAQVTRRFGDAVIRADEVLGRDAKTEALRRTWVAEVEMAAEERAKERHRRYGWRGRPATRRALPQPQPQRPRGRPGKGS